MRYAMRISLPDRPGALAGVATALGAAGVDVVGLAVVERADGVAVDDVDVDGVISADVLRRTVEQVGGVAVEAVTLVDDLAGRPTATALAAELAESGGDVWQRLVDGLPGPFSGTWAVAVRDGVAGLETMAASAGAPNVPAGLRRPFVPVDRARRLPQAAWMPRSWCGAGVRAELAAAALGDTSHAVIVARPVGPRFRRPELDRLGEIARVAVAASAAARVVI